MNTTTASTATPIAQRRSNIAYRWMRQFHLWIGAWGAIAAILYGFTGLMMNHRFGDKAWPQGDNQDTGQVVLQVPAEARDTPEALTTWLRQAHGLDAQVVRKGPPGGAKLGGKEIPQPPKWTISGGTARNAWSLEFIPGNATAEVKQTRHSPLSALNRLHKAVGGGWAWRVLADTFALGMVLLGLSGIWMWARGRSPREMVLSVFGMSSLVLGVVLAAALL